MTSDPCGEFLAAVEGLRDDNGVRLTAHTASVSADAWAEPTQPTEAAPAVSAD
ncbi:hypothetical protein [Streptomyces lunaelactis]|uniref:hypothetical protein n=1 Tax=Streptomyces lunaelactis TaxID=1535768 RepID=UPI0020C7872C|nr:hypothetical protein [Streptomyces lunaelactis]